MRREVVSCRYARHFHTLSATVRGRSQESRDFPFRLLVTISFFRSTNKILDGFSMDAYVSDLIDFDRFRLMEQDPLIIIHDEPNYQPAEGYHRVGLGSSQASAGHSSIVD